MFAGASTGSRLEQGPEVGGPQHNPGPDRDVRGGQLRRNGRTQLRNRLRRQE